MNIKTRLITLIYKYICKVYQFITTFFENILFKDHKGDNSLTRTGFFKHSIDKLNINRLSDNQTYPVNKYLYIHLVKDKKVDEIISRVFNKEFRYLITEKTGFKYSIDYFIMYDRHYIPKELTNVSTLEQYYSYRWHFDKPNSSNMLKIIIPINITKNHGPLNMLEKKPSANLNHFEPNRFFKRIEFIGELETIYGFMPTICWHKDGIPDQGLIATQIMFQLNPWNEWSVNESIKKMNPKLNKNLKIWTTEPKFRWLTLNNRKRIAL